MGRAKQAAASNVELLQWLQWGQFELARDAAQAAIRQRPRDGKLWQLLGLALLQLGLERPAEAALRQAARLLPGDAEVRDNLVTLARSRAAALLPELNAAMGAGRFDAALRLADRAIELDTLAGGHHNNRAVALAGLQRLAEAIASCRRAVELAPDSPEFLHNLATMLSADGQHEAALQCHRQTLLLDPRDLRSRQMLARAAANQGRLAEAQAYCCGDAAEAPDDLLAFSNLLFYLSLDETVTPAALFAAHRAYGERVAAQIPADRLAHRQPRDPARRLRLGFVSADLYSHPAAGFIEPVWRALDRAQVEIRVYAGQVRADEVTARLRSLDLHWLEVQGLTDAELAARIHADGIDVLFDLSGHTGGHRLPTFARRPAPVQVTWIGYPNTTGLQTMDYALCDRHNAPPGLYEAYYVEKFARIPCSGTFSAPVELPAVGALPALAAGRVTFGSFNRIGKLGPAVLQAWARVLQAVPGSRLLIGQVHDEALAQRLRDDFARLDVPVERLCLQPPLPLQDYLALHDQVDILLDSWPYTGGTTTNYALAMGVPVVTLQGPGRAHCQSAGVLGRIGLGDWVARDVDGFVALAAARAGDLPALAALRAGLRQRWQHTPLRQPASVARGLEAAVRAMWQRWCAGLPAEHFEVLPPGDGATVRWGSPSP